MVPAAHMLGQGGKDMGEKLSRKTFRMVSLQETRACAVTTVYVECLRSAGERGTAHVPRLQRWARARERGALTDRALLATRMTGGGG